ncbi:KaiC domain-containing protein [Halorubrum gandharaense]
MSEEDEDDWFERALRDLEGDEEAAEAAEADDTDDTDDTEAPPGSDGDEDAEPAERGKEATEKPDQVSEPTGEPVPDSEEDPFGGVRDGAGDAPTGESDASVAPPERDAGDAEEPAPFADRGSAPTTGDENDPFGGFGGSGGGEFGGSDGGDEFGFADFGEGGGGGGSPEAGGSPTAFEEESFESDIERIRIGIEGLDEMILGGVPRRSLISVIGSPGTGKSTLALQFLHEALRSGERAVYITLEESREAILDTAEEKGWSFRQYEEEGLLAVVPLDPIEMANSLASIRNDLTRLISEFGAERLVLDSVSLLEMMYDTPAKRRSEVFDFTRSLKEAGVTTLVTSEASQEHAYTSRYGLVEYLTDAVFILQYVRPDDFRETRLAVEIQKIRDANHSRETKPYEITDDGISVYRQANIF